MSCQLIKYMNTLNITQNVIPHKKKKNMYTVKDGIISFTVDLNSINNPCKLCCNYQECNIRRCTHYFSVLQYIGIPEYTISLIGIDHNIIHLINNEELSVQDKDVECCICLDTCWDFYGNSKIYQCLYCSKFYHTKCFEKTKSVLCLHCNNKVH
jgi:hypothetical protein